MWHIFYLDSTKEINWSTNGLVNDSIKTAQADLGLSYLQVDMDAVPSSNDYWVNSVGTGVIEKSIFNPTFSTTTPAVDGVINVTGLPAGTEVFIDDTSAGTMSDTTLTLTVQQSGTYKIRFKKLHYKNHSGATVTVKRYV